jgi:hypothetical protein
LEKTVVRLSLILCALLISLEASAKTISNVTVCAIACNSEIEEETNLDNFASGTVYFATFNKKTKHDSNLCMKQAHHLPTYEFQPDQEELIHKGCSEVLSDRFFGKRVDIVVAEDEN